MKFKSKILCLLLVLAMLLSVSAAAAANENTTMPFKEDSTDQMSVNVETGNEILGISNNEENLCATYDGTRRQTGCCGFPEYWMLSGPYPRFVSFSVWI